MKRLLTIILICINSSILLAQPQVEVSGQVKDAQTKKALEFCSISVFDTNDSLITGSVTNNKGFFTILLQKGSYRFIFNYLGYKTDTTGVTTVTENTFLGVFKLELDENLLNEVTVKASTRENLLDRDVRIVTDKLRTGASDTKDVLDKLEGVNLDRFNNSIKVDNDANIIILVDGLEKDQEYILNLSPDRLQKIEIIRDPGGRYGLEGFSAVINIILKKDYKGTELYFSEELITDLDAVNRNYIFPKNNLSATLNYTYNKVNLYAKYSNNYDNFNLPSSSNKEYDDELIIENNPPDDEELNIKMQGFSNRYTIGADYYINPRQTISFESNLTASPLGKNITKGIYDAVYIENGNITDNFDIETKNTSEDRSSYNSLFYVGKLNGNNTLNVDFTYSYYNDNYTNTYRENPLYERIEKGTDYKHNTKFYSEYNHTFNDKTNLQIGYGNTWKKLNNNYTSETTTETVNGLYNEESQFKYTDIRHKLYAYYSWQHSGKFGVKIGGAGETSSPEADGQKKSYFIFQPYADIKYKPFGFLGFRAKYRASSNYPNISQTNPFTYTVDQQSVKTGNPDLSPELVHKISLKTNILNGLVTIEPYYHFSDNYITETGTLRDDSIFEYGYDNIGKYTNYGIKASFTVPFRKILFLQSNFDFYKSSISYAGKTNNINDWTMNNKLIYANQKSGTVLGFMYQNNLSKVITAQGYNKWYNDFWGLFIQQPFFKKKLNVMVFYLTPITWGVDFKQGSYIETDTYRESTFNDISILKNMVILRVSFRFNKGKSIKKTEKNIEQEIEKSSKGVF